MDYFLEDWQINQSNLYNDSSAEKNNQKLQPWHQTSSKPPPIKIPEIKTKLITNQQINNANRLRKRRLQRLKQNQLLELFLQKNTHISQPPASNKTQPIDKNSNKIQLKEIQKEKQCFRSNLYRFFQDELKNNLTLVKQYKNKNNQFHLQKVLKQKQKIRKRNYSQVQKIKSSVINGGYIGVLQKQFQLKKAKRSISQKVRFCQQQKMFADKNNKSSKIVEFYKTQPINTKGQKVSNNSGLNSFGSFLSKTFYI